MADVAKFERHLHSCQVVLWLKQNYRAAGDHADREAILKESVYAHYVEMCRRDMPHIFYGCGGGNLLFSKAVVGKMVKRAFPHVRSRRLGVKGTIRQYYTGIRRLQAEASCAPSSSSSSSPRRCSSEPSMMTTTSPFPYPTAASAASDAPSSSSSPSSTTSSPTGSPLLTMMATFSPSTSCSSSSSSSSPARSSFSTASSSDNWSPIERLFDEQRQKTSTTTTTTTADSSSTAHDWLGPVLAWAEAIISPAPLTVVQSTANVSVYS